MAAYADPTNPNLTQFSLHCLPSLHHSQEEIEITDEYTVFRYYLSPTYDFIQEILSHGYNVEVLAPKHVRDEVRQHAEVIASRG